jgi:hypothetical protein
MADVVLDEASYLHAVPPQLRDIAVLVEPLTIARQRIFG